MTHLKNISTYISRITISIAVLLMAPQFAIAQNKKLQDGKRLMVQKNDTTALFMGFSVSADIVGPAMLLFGDYGQYEGALRINLKDKYFPIIELGYGKCDHIEETTNIRYKTNAPYIKIGMDFNLLKNKHSGNRLYAGARYAFTSYKDDISLPEFQDPVWGYPVDYQYSGNKCHYHWIEAVFGVEAKIYGPFHLGWSARYRKRVAFDEGILGKSWYVPGFGKSDNSSLGATFNIIIDI